MADGWQPPGDGGGARFRLRQALDALVYGVAFTLVTGVVAAGLSFALGGGWFGVEFALFVGGAALLAYASFQLRPAKRWDVSFEEDGYRITRPGDGGRVLGSREESRFQASVQRVPPLPWVGLPVEARLSPAAKLFVAGATMLAASVLLEALLFW
ncbi:hypothetical protein JCM30237_03760 [Halolamina litorea]|uniref:DUF2244 domain-containing protein n=1 Tax=Halolamina litorea TaxID=1515593 RepID=A0ABD6BSI1_9EURY|nr:hypothetical protein [Halolamina litorea]